MKRLFIKSKTFVNYILSYSAVLLLQLVIMLMLIQTVILPEMKNNIVKVNIENLKKASEQIEKKFSVIEKISYEISNSQKLSPYTMKENSGEGLQQMFSYQNSNDFVQDILYVILKNDLIYGVHNEMTINRLTENVYPFKEWKNGGFYDEINNVKQPMVRPLTIENGEKYVAYFSPLKPFQPYAVVIYLIKSTTFGDIIQGLYTDYNENVIILDSNNQVITALNSNTGVLDNQLNLINSCNMADMGSSLTDLKKNNLITIFKSPRNQWKYISIADSGKLMEKIHMINRVIIATTISVFILEAILILWLSRRNYLPIHILTGKITGRLGMNLKNGKEFEFIEGAFNDIINKNQNLEKSIDAHRPILREYILKEILKGKSVSELIKEDMENILISEGYCYQCLVFQVYDMKQNNNAEINPESLAYNLNVKWKENIKICFVDTMEKTKFIFIVSILKDQLEKVESIVKEIYNYVSEEINTKFTIGAGNVYSDILSIGQSYLEANKVFSSNQSNSRQDNPILVYDKIQEYGDDEKEENTYPYAELNQLITYIKQGKEEQIRSTLHGIFSDIEKKNLPKFLARCITLDIFNVIVNIMMEEELNYKEFKEKYLDAFYSKKYAEANELNQDLTILSIEMCHNICKQIKKKNENFDEILAFIQGHCFENHFSSDRLSKHVELSVSYLSQYFKDKTGDTLSNYLWKIRLKKAKELLEQGDNTIQDIVSAIGFSDVSTFTRRFKSSEGVSPGEYRKNSKFSNAN